MGHEARAIDKKNSSSTDTRLADRTTNLAYDASAAEPNPSSSASTKTLAPKGKGPATADDASSSAVAQLRAELASTQRTRGDLEIQLRTLSAEVSTLKDSDTQQK